jgi:hypothetical protein
MRQISSSGTFFSKRVFPALFLGLLGFFAHDTFTNNSPYDDPIAFVGPVVMVLIGGFVYKVFISDLADEVVDHGSFLSVRRGSLEDKIYIENIMNVSATQFVNPPRVTLRLVQPSKFGREVTFSPKVGFTLNPMSKPKIVEELIERAYEARRR